MLLSITGHRRFVGSRLVSEAHRTESKQSGGNNGRKKYLRHYRSLFVRCSGIISEKTKNNRGCLLVVFCFLPMILRYGAHCYLQVGSRLSFSQKVCLSVV